MQGVLRIGLCLLAKEAMIDNLHQERTHLACKHRHRVRQTAISELNSKTTSMLLPRVQAAHLDVEQQEHLMSRRFRRRFCYGTSLYRE